MKKVFICLSIFVILISCRESLASVVDKIIATVNGKPITTYELKNIAPLYQAKNLNDLLNKVIDDYIIKEYAQNVGITVNDEQVEMYLENLASRNNLSVDDYLNKLKNAGIDIEEFKKGVRLVVYRYVFARRVFLPSISISKKEIENYYKLHKSEFQNANKVLVLSIITLDNLQVAQNVYNKLKKGVDFYKLLKKYSLSKEKFREIPASVLNPALQEKILSLNKGDFTNIIESNGKYYIVKLVDIKTANDVENQIRSILITQRIVAKLKSWLKMIRSRSDIEVFLK